MRATKINKNQGTTFFVFAQKNAAHCIGEQKQK